MASYRFHFRPSSKQGLQKGKLFIRLIHDRIPKNIRTPYTIFPHEWCSQSQRVVLPRENGERMVYLLDLHEQIADDLKRLDTIVRNLASRERYSVSDIAEAFDVKAGDDTLLAYTEVLGKKLREEKRPRTARAYRTVANGLIRFNGGRNLALTDIDTTLLLNFQEHLRMQGRHFNTISFYMRNLRAIYNKAIKDKKLPPRRESPFCCVYTGICESMRRALPLSDVAKLYSRRTEMENCIQEDSKRSIRKRQVQHSLYRTLRYFMFCCEARGMSFVDMIYLKKGDITEDKVQYMRKKTGQILNVKITDEMRSVIDTFGDKGASPYIFPILDPSKPDLRLQYESALRVQNKRLNRIGANIGLSIPLTTHVARHTWATLAKWNNVEIAKISEGLGHSNIKTTIRYLDSFEESVMDQVSDQIANLLKYVA